MTDIPQVYLDEAVRRCNEGFHGRYYSGEWPVKVLARTLQELGWQPPVDPMLVRARESERADVAAWLRKPVMGGDHFEPVNDTRAMIAAAIEAREHLT